MQLPRLISRPFYVACCMLVLGASLVAMSAEAAGYLGPCSVVASKDGKALYVANADAKQIALVDPAARAVKKTIAVPEEPTGMVLSPDGAKLYVTCSAPKSTIAVVELGSGQVSGSIPAGYWTTGPSIDPSGKRLYVCNRYTNDVSVIDLEARKEIARVPAVREPYASAITPDGKSVYVLNLVPLDRSDSYDVAAIITVIDTANNQTTAIRLPNGSGSLRSVCVSPDGKYVYAVHILSRYQMPTTQLERGWMNTNAMSIIDASSKKLINTVLLDDVDLGAANPWSVTTTADGKTICVSHAGTHEISVIDAAGLLDKLVKIASPPAPAEKEKPAAEKDKAAAEKEKPAAGKDKAAAEKDKAAAEKGKPAEKDKKPEPKPIYAASASLTAADVPNDLAFLVGLRRRIKVDGNGPRGLAVVGSTVYAAEYFTDTLGVIDLESKAMRPVSQIALGPKPQLTVQRRGEMLFNDAEMCFQHWQSCESCHPDSRVDGLNWDLMNDGLGNPKNTRTMVWVHQAGPAMSLGVRETAEAAVRAGITHILFAVRPEEEAKAIDEYLKSLQPLPSPHLVDGKLSDAAQRGKKTFFDPVVGCANCHPEPIYTDKKAHDVGSTGKYDKPADKFNTPRLVELWRTAPYMHDGQYLTLKELFAKGKHGAKGGDISKLSDKDIDDLVEFLLSL